jgi:hypothetical protein
MSRALTILGTVVALAVSAAPATAATNNGPNTPTPTVGTAPPPANGIIMRDGGICNPAWGC